MLSVLHVVAVAIPMALVLAHALEYPGKLRLARDDYLTVQPIYYPGFTIGGFAEPAALLALVMLLFLTPPGTAAFWLTLAAFASMALMHVAYWLLTHPVNNFWLRTPTSKEQAPGSSRRVRARSTRRTGGAFVTGGRCRTSYALSSPSRLSSCS